MRPSNAVFGDHNLNSPRKRVMAFDQPINHSRWYSSGLLLSI
jgi:hypothetical protein